MLLFRVLLVLAMAGAAVWALFVGAYQVGGAWQSLREYWASGVHSPESYVLWELRLPRILMALFAGAGLSISGASLQGLFKNPLAAPDLIGITAGAVLFAALTIVLGGVLLDYFPAVFRYVALSVMAFLGALLTMIFVYRMATTKGKTHLLILLLAGVAIGALTGAVTGFLTYLSSEEELRTLTFWSLGSLAGANWWKVLLVAVVVSVCSVFLLRKGKVLNALMLGEEEAKYLGFDMERTKREVIVCSALMVGTVVAFNGTIGFVGLIVPYILRFFFQSNYVMLLPMSLLLGGVLLLVADTLSRILVLPAELPIGILTALMGAPIFISILMNYKKKLR